MKIDNNILISWDEEATGEAYIPDGITGMHSDAFIHCKNLTSISIPASLICAQWFPSYNIKFLSDNIEEIYYRGSLKQWCSNYLFKLILDKPVDLYINGEKVVNLIIPDDIKELSSHCFCNIKSLHTIKFNSVISIKSFAFKNCINLEHIDFGSCLEVIDVSAFIYCIKLKDIIFPDSLTHIDFNAFYNCNSIEYISGGKNITYIDNSFDFFENVQITQCYENKRVVAYKAFNRDLTCRDFQYEVGKTFTMKDNPSLCRHGFHACLNPLSVFNYYRGDLNNIKIQKSIS